MTGFLTGVITVNIVLSIVLAGVVLDMRQANDKLEREVERLRSLVLPPE